MSPDSTRHPLAESHWFRSLDRHVCLQLLVANKSYFLCLTRCLVGIHNLSVGCGWIDRSNNECNLQGLDMCLKFDYVKQNTVLPTGISYPFLPSTMVLTLAHQNPLEDVLKQRPTGPTTRVIALLSHQPGRMLPTWFPCPLGTLHPTAPARQPLQPRSLIVFTVSLFY